VEQRFSVLHPGKNFNINLAKPVRHGELLCGPVGEVDDAAVVNQVAPVVDPDNNDF